MDDIEQRGGVGGDNSIIKTSQDLTEHDPWVLAAIQELTKVALECGFWDLDSLDDTSSGPMPYKDHPVWEIVHTKRAELSEEEAIWQRPIWMTADDGLPCVYWIPNLRLAFAAADRGPSSSVPSDVHSDDFDEEELRGRRQTPRPMHATSVSVADEGDDPRGEAEGDTHVLHTKEEDFVKEAEEVRGKDSDSGKSTTESEGKDIASK
ncbi:hypothetical protein HDK77DRAFT_487994 [Phyllosticta capitalensis]